MPGSQDVKGSAKRGPAQLPAALQDRLRRNRFAVLGRAGMDFYAEPPGTRLEAARNFVAHLGGSAANIAVALVRLGATADLLSRVSDDAVGRFCLAELDRYGVGRTHVGLADGGARTSLAVVETRSQNCQSVIYRNDAADFALTMGDVEGVDFQSLGALVVTGTALAHPSSHDACLLALERARDAGAVTVLDVDFRPYSWPSRDAARSAKLRAAALCDIVVGNDEEFGLMAGSMAEGLPLARKLAAGSCAAVIYKMGDKGAVTISSGTEITTGIYPVQALKPTGAGDAFMGGVLSSLARGADIETAVLAGSAAAAIVVTRVGCAPASPSAAELADFLSRHPVPASSKEAPLAHPAP